MDGSLKVYTRAPWQDYAQGLILTVTHTWYTAISIGTGVAFGLVQQSLERIILHLLAWICYLLGQRESRPDQAGANEAVGDDTSPLLHRPPRKERKQCIPSGGWRTLFSSHVVARLSSWVIISFTIAWSVAGAFVTTVSTDEAALSGSRICGLWGLTDTANAAAQDADALLQGEKETRAGQYARDCYGPRSTSSLDQCMLFRNPMVPTSRIDVGQRCPFVNESYCSGTGATAVRFSTGLVDASTIGLNAKKTPKFNRTTMCVPLNVEEPPRGPGFVKKADARLKGWWSFDLGPVESDEYRSPYTFEQFGDPFDFDVRAYTMSAYLHVYSKAKRDNYWQPKPALRIRKELNTKSEPYSLTVMFINSCRIYYKDASVDPIFPADLRWPRESDLWIKNDSIARPLACVDWIEACTHGGHCSAPYQEGPDEDENYVLTRFALNKSTAFHSIEFRGATGLDAQYKVRGDTSLPLDERPPQWIVESWRLFNTSLARVQYDALDIANGTGWDKSLYVPKLPNWAQDKMCRIFTFQIPKGYDNVRIGVEIGILLIPLTAFLVGWQTSEEFSEKRQRSGYFDGLNLIGIEWLVKRLQTRATRQHERLPEARDSQSSHDSQQERHQNEANSTAPNASNYGSISASEQAHIPTAQAATSVAGAQQPEPQATSPIKFGATVTSTSTTKSADVDQSIAPSNDGTSSSTGAKDDISQQQDSRDP